MDLKSKISVELTKKGCSVLQSQNNLFDLVVSFYDQMDKCTVFMIISKNGTITKEQDKFTRSWRGEVVVVSDVLGALDSVGKLQH